MLLSAAGAHTRSIALATPSTHSGGIMRFAKVRLSCLGCRTPLPPGTSDLCKHCRHKVALPLGPCLPSFNATRWHHIWASHRMMTQRNTFAGRLYHSHKVAVTPHDTGAHTRKASSSSHHSRAVCLDNLIRTAG